MEAVKINFKLLSNMFDWTKNGAIVIKLHNLKESLIKYLEVRENKSINACNLCFALIMTLKIHVVFVTGEKRKVKCGSYVSVEILI
jgi:hypothetical protein